MVVNGLDAYTEVEFLFERGAERNPVKGIVRDMPEYFGQCRRVTTGFSEWFVDRAMLEQMGVVGLRVGDVVLVDGRDVV
jgi:hypothetical protein